jgi:Uma2 family endonuclease
MAGADAEERVSPEEYLARERLAETRSEYLGGSIVARPASNRNHNHVAGDILGELHQQLRDTTCDVFLVNMRVKIAATSDYTYPDVVVACGNLQFEDAEEDSLLTPTVIIEVLSPSTERNDRGLKFASYRQLPTLMEYLLVAQDQPSVEHFVRQGDQWLLTITTDLDATVHLVSIGCELRLSEIYRQVPLDGGDPPNNRRASSQ